MKKMTINDAFLRRRTIIEKKTHDAFVRHRNSCLYNLEILIDNFNNCSSSSHRKRRIMFIIGTNSASMACSGWSRTFSSQRCPKDMKKTAQIQGATSYPIYGPLSVAMIMLKKTFDNDGPLSAATSKWISIWVMMKMMAHFWWPPPMDIFTMNMPIRRRRFGKISRIFEIVIELCVVPS